ncbi:hypothetical protein GWI33_005731 [Rhynchophorus ferrugineus]|uniref:Ig-like domain-containing protein n=1 Tax=Rhynchophorus ferrugineus TaxID=354439 RepID=A0A834IVK3_RHYFE|nr:hypothetical protein GWI33_005731 [Rhynchophorus ferrugineus]
MQISLWHLYSIMLLQIANEVSACSLFCICKWKNGKRTAECANKGLIDIPDNVDPETQVLDFSDNRLGKLGKELFHKKQLVNLQRLYLSRCQIKAIHKDTFKGLTNLVEMDLSHNFLESVPTGAFMNCPSLMKLTLGSNPIATVKKLAFNHLSYLNTLELNGCEIADIEEGAFQGLHSLEWLHLDSNRLRTIRSPETLPKTLKGIELQKNPWTCDCHIQDFHQWLINFHIPLSGEPACVEPTRLQHMLVKNVPKEELACLPDVSPTTFYLELGEGKNVSLLCHVHAVPEATVSWWFDGQLLQNNTNVAPGVHLMYFVEEGTENKRSELFIYNANADDNGTYVCHAENAAGTAQSNFTIRIILKEDPIVIIVSFSIEYLLFAVVGVGIFVLLIIVIVVVCIVKCQRKRKRQLKRDQTKEVALHLQQNQTVGNGDKNWANKSISSSPLEPQLKQNNVTPTTQTTTCTTEPDEVIIYGIRNCDEQFNKNMSPVRMGSRSACQSVSPLSLRRYQLEQNPDLINGTESIGCRRAGDGEDGRQRGEEETPGVACLRSSGDFYGDQNNAIGKNPVTKLQVMTETLNTIRYTADGYPVPRQTTGPMLPPTTSTPPPSMPCCSANWPPCLPANQPLISNVSKKCASAQTDTEDECDSISVSVSASVKNEPAVINVPHDNANDVLTESPDEGYEGEPSVV